jgi:hypothetical protein
LYKDKKAPQENYVKHSLLSWKHSLLAAFADSKEDVIRRRSNDRQSAAATQA